MSFACHGQKVSVPFDYLGFFAFHNYGLVGPKDVPAQRIHGLY